MKEEDAGHRGAGQGLAVSGTQAFLPGWGRAEKGHRGTWDSVGGRWTHPSWGGRACDTAWGLCP